MTTATHRLLLVTAALGVALAGCSTADKNVAPAPQLAPVAAPAPLPPPPVVVAPAPMVYVIDDVNFEFDKSMLRPSATDTLDPVADELRQQAAVNCSLTHRRPSTNSRSSAVVPGAMRRARSLGQPRRLWS
jgi:hypothetical protein